MNTLHKSDSILEETISKIGVTIIAKAVKMMPQLSLGIVFVSTSRFLDNKSFNCPFHLLSSKTAL